MANLPGPGCTVVLGDNRPASWDSRHYGFVPRDRTVGVVVRHVSHESLLVIDHVAGSRSLDGRGCPRRGGGGSPASSRVSRRVMMATVAHHTIAS
jgi:hypothetical protein